MSKKSWIKCTIEPKIGDRIIVFREFHNCYAEGIYEGNQTILTSPGCHFGSYDKWLLVEPVQTENIDVAEKLVHSEDMKCAKRVNELLKKAKQMFNEQRHKIDIPNFYTEREIGILHGIERIVKMIERDNYPYKGY
jgi:Txe/YoeB family toxin of Txe-Axe toxin-antitoxin module